MKEWLLLYLQVRVLPSLQSKTTNMKAINNNNRYYCHRRQKTGKLIPRQRVVFLNYSEKEQIDKYAQRLRDVYGYSIQLQIG